MRWGSISIWTHFDRAGLGEEFDVGEGGADDEEGVAVFERVLRGLGAEEADAAGGVRAVVGDSGFAEEGFDDGCAEKFGNLLQLVGGAESALAGEDGDAFAAVENVGGMFQIDLGGQVVRESGRGRGVVRRIARGAALLHFLDLNIDGDGDVGDAALLDGGADGEVGNAFHVGAAHDALVVDGDILVELVEGDILLGEGADEVGVLHAGDGEDGLAVHFGVVEAVEQMNAAGAGGGDADADAAGEFGIGAGGKGGGFLVAHVDEADAVFVLAEGFKDAIDAVAGNAEDRVHTPGNEAFDQHVGSVHDCVLNG